MKSELKNKFTKQHRVLHWSLAILISISFITGFLRMVWMGKKAVIHAVQVNSDLTRDQAVSIYKTLREPMWQWHVYAAYLIVFVFILRILYMIVEGIRFPNPFKSTSTGREKFNGAVYIIFYVFLAVQVVTGLGLKFLSGDIKHSIETIHKLAIYWFPIFILLHLAGVVLAELTHKKGIVSKMIGGE